MKKLLIIGAMLVSAASGASAQNLSLQLGQTGYYGSIDLGNLRAPPVIYQQPIIIDRSVHYSGQPMYMRVPPGHAKKWSKHCGAYNACGRPVYFVQDSWYSNTYAPQYRRSHGGRGDDRNYGHDRHDRDDRDDRYEKHGKDKHDKHGKDKHDKQGKRDKHD